MDTHIALTLALHAIRHEKPHEQIATDAGVSPDQLWKYRQGARIPRIDEWRRIIRSVAEVSACQAETLARAVVPAELFTITRHNHHPGDLAREIMESGAAVGRLQDVFLLASADGVIDCEELSACERAYQDLKKEAEEGLARIAHKRIQRQGG